MDLFDEEELEGKKEVEPARPLRFAPKSKLKKQPAKAEPEVEPPLPAKYEVKPAVVLKKEKVSEAVEEMEVDVEFNNRDGVGDGGVDVMEEDGEKEVSTSAVRNGEDVMGEGEEEDQVVAEYDVYFTPRDPDTQLYVMQYPLRPSWRPYEIEQRCTEVRVRPNSAEVEMDLSIDVNSDNFDPDSPLAQKMEKQTLTSSRRPPQDSGYAVGLLTGKKLYLNPIHAVVQLRPSMEYLDFVGSRQKNSNMVVNEESSSRDAVGPSKKQNKKPDSELVEPWIPLKYYSSTSELAQRYLRKMVTEEDKPLQFSMNPYDYLNSLCPGAVINKMNSGGPSKRALLSLPLEERLKTWLAEGPPVQRFTAIKYLAPDDPVEDVLQILQKYAHLVQGLWVPSGEIRYAKEKAKAGEAFARDYALSLFHRCPVVKDSELAVLGSLKNVAKPIIREFAVERPTRKDWKFKEPTDVSFIKLYPDVVENQNKLWQDHEIRLEAYIKIRSGSQNVKKLGVSVRPGESAAKATTVAPRSASSSMPRETREALSKVLGKLFQTQRVCNLQTICQGLRDTAVSMSTNPKTGARATAAAAVAAVKSVIDAPQEDLQAIISEFAVDVHGVYLLKPSTENPELNSLRNVVIDLFRERAPGAKVKKGEIMDAVKTQPTTNEFQKVINEYCVSQGGAWVLKTGDGVTPNDWQGFFKAAKLL